MSTAFDLKIPVSAVKAILPWLLALVLGATSGGGLATFTDVTGAREYKDSVAEQIAMNKELSARVTALRAQNEQLLELFDRCVVRTEP